MQNNLCSNKSKYAIASINIPIEIFPDGEWINHNDRITVKINKISNLPPISDIENQKLLDTIQEILGGSSQEVEDQSSLKISLNQRRYDDHNQPLPFKISIREPIREPIREHIREHIREPIQDTTNYIDNQELLLRKRRIPSKNSSFKHINIKPHNKTRSNRWVLMKDTKDAEY